MNKISACIVLKNEEKLIERCLISIYKIVDEIIIVHDGNCRDKTLDICKKYKTKIYIKNDYGNCNPHRPFSFKKASNNWLLQIDADEFLSEDLQNKINNLIKKKGTNAYKFLWPIWNGRKYITKNWPYKICLFRKEKVSFLGIPNSVPTINGLVEKLDLVLEHRPYKNNFSFYVFRKKLVPKAKLQASYYLKDFSEIKKYNINDLYWPRKVKYRVKYPLLLMPLEFAITLFKNLISGGYKEFFTGYKIAFLFALYRVILNYYIFKIKKNSKKIFYI